MKLNLRSIIRGFSYYILPSLLLLFSIITNDEHFFVGLGNFAITFLIIVMFIKPIAVIFNYSFFRTVLSYRREIGLISFWFFLFHVAGIIYTQKLYSLNIYFGFENFLFWGLISTIGMLVVGLTSNNFSVRLLKKNWKKVQYFAYIAFLGALLHVGLMHEKREFLQYLLIGIVYITLKIVQVYTEKRRVVLLKNTQKLES